MNKDQVNGRIDEVKGKVKEAIGIAVGDKKLEKKGKAKRIKGAIQAEFGDVKAEIKKII
ncbi:MAG TPA: CsbD family protein [Rectinemataceae bacterium]|nr:CsbD family protein [Rectinemataceae bacterium]